MKHKTFIALAFFFIFLSTVYAASSEGQISFDNQGGKIVVSAGGSCQEDWSGSTWSQCTNNKQTFICFDRNYCGTTILKPAQCDTTRACGTSSGSSSSSGGGGGGSSSGSGGGTYIATGNENQTTESPVCVEKWECGDWSRNGCGVRTCTDLNNCSTTDLKPFVEQKCQVGFVESLLSFMTGGVIFGGTTSDSKTNGNLFLIIVIAVVATIAVSGFSYWSRKKSEVKIKKRVKEILKKKK